jgi:two-component sensor histidine kinase
MCFVLTLIAVLAATALRLSLGKIGVTITYPTYYLAILIVALVCGAGGGILAIALSMLAVDYVFIPPPFSFALPSKEAIVNMAAFALVSLAIVAIAHAQRGLVDRLNYKREALALLMKELQHRSKNHLSVVQAIVAHSIRGDNERSRLIAGRIKCIADADNLLTKSPQQSVGLAELLELELMPFRQAVKTAGPSVILGPTLAQVIALVLHELCTNANKYGALSKEGGYVSVTWSVLDESLHLRWAELGGPAVSSPSKGGFGLGFLNSLLKNVKGKITTEFPADGVVHTIVAPLDFLDAASHQAPPQLYATLVDRIPSPASSQ